MRNPFHCIYVHTVYILFTIVYIGFDSIYTVLHATYYYFTDVYFLLPSCCCNVENVPTVGRIKNYLILFYEKTIYCDCTKAPP